MQKTNLNRILVIGGTGFIGSNLIRYLLSTGKEIAIYHREDSDLRHLNNLTFTSIIGDLMDKDHVENTLGDAMDGCEAVYNLAVVDTPLKRYYPLMETINIKAAGAIARLARETGIRRLVHVSSSTAIGYPVKNEILNENSKFNAHNDPYARTKHMGEQTVLKEVEKGLNAVIAIPCSTLGSFAIKDHQKNVFKNISSGKMKVYPPGGLCLTNVNDLIRGMVLCHEKGKTGSRYILGGHNITYKQYFHEIASVTGGKEPAIRLPKLLMPWLGLGVEMLCGIMNKDTNLSKKIAQMISMNLYYSSELAVKELGYQISDWKMTIKDTAQQLKIGKP
jgi:dihydroflavonol-4-reductase